MQKRERTKDGTFDETGDRGVQLNQGGTTKFRRGWQPTGLILILNSFVQSFTIKPLNAG